MPSAIAELTEYLGLVDKLHGTYVDAITGFSALTEEIDDLERTALASGRTKQEFANATFTYASNPGRPQSSLVHSCKMTDYRSRNQLGGANYVVLGQLFVVLAYGYWEDTYRARIASALLRKKKNDINSDLLGDLARIRHDIVHHRGIAQQRNVDKYITRAWFKDGDVIALTHVQIEHVVIALNRDLPTYVAGL